MSDKHVTIVSPFRDSEKTIPAYKNRINLLAYPPENIRIVCVEGDSADHTYATLYGWADEDIRVTLVKQNINRPKWPSLVIKDRFADLAKVFNKGLDTVDTEWSDYVFFLPSDVLYRPDVLSRLIAHDKDYIAPMFWAGDGAGKRFYDIWGFTYQGKSFKPLTPAWYSQNIPQGPIQMDTVGGAILIKVDVLKAGCRYTFDEVDHGLCKMAQAEGFEVWCDTTTHVLHGEG